MNELVWVSIWCAGIGGATEVVLEDRTRVDCLTEEVAWEVDRGGGWAQAVGQSLHYAAVTQRKPGIVLLLPSAAQEKRLRNIIETYGLPIRVEVVR